MTGVRVKLVVLSLLLYPFLLWGPLVVLMQFPRLGLPAPIVYVVVFVAMAAGLAATPLLARALLVHSDPEARKLSPLWLAGGALTGGLAAALADAAAPSAVQAVGRGFLDVGLALAGILLGSFREA